MTKQACRTLEDAVQPQPRQTSLFCKIFFITSQTYSKSNNFTDRTEVLKPSGPIIAFFWTNALDCSNCLYKANSCTKLTFGLPANASLCMGFRGLKNTPLFIIRKWASGCTINKITQKYVLMNMIQFHTNIQN